MPPSPRNRFEETRIKAPLIVSIFFPLLVLFACDGPTEPQRIPYVRVKPEWVIGEAASALDTLSGTFRLVLPGSATVGLMSAETLALAVARLYSDPNMIGNGPAQAEQDRGGPIDFGRLRLCARPTYSVSPLTNLPSTLPAAVRRGWSSQWAIPLCGGDGEVGLSVGVPDEQMDVRVVDGQIVFPGGTSGNDFSTVGVPPRFPFGLPLTPEEAVATVVAQTGRVITHVPVAYDQHDDRGIGELPLCASWRIRVDVPVDIRTNAGELRLIDEFFVRRTPACFSDAVALFAPRSEQPSTRWLAYVAQDNRIDSVQVSVSGPVAFEEVTVLAR